ncbi:MAG: hypothetical protein JNM66_34215 [Bryobacterales bacterium]|nr:hypothetical protein [Bryobacterales bacterium]
MEYWDIARAYAREKAQLFVPWKAMPAVIVVSIQYFGLESIQLSQAIKIALLAVASYAIAHFADYLYRLLIKAPKHTYAECISKIHAIGATLNSERMAFKAETEKPNPWETVVEMEVTASISKLSDIEINCVKSLLAFGEMSEQELRQRGIDPKIAAAVIAKTANTLVSIRYDWSTNGAVLRGTYHSVNKSIQPILKWMLTKD